MTHTFRLKNGATWTLDHVQILSALTQAYPSLNLDAELRKAALWLEANPSKRKTPAGMQRFVVAWLNRAGRPGRQTDVPFTDGELRQARRVLANSMGCTHAPRCATSTACEGLLIRGWRDARRQSAGV